MNKIEMIKKGNRHLDIIKSIRISLKNEETIERLNIDLSKSVRQWLDSLEFEKWKSK